MQREKARRVIFYSWQSDLPNATNRGFIEASLNEAAKAIYRDGSIQVEPVIDRDIAGIPGSPDIDLAILKKIEEADIVVCDVSIINREYVGRPTPNPNVLIECGYALKALGWERLILVMNTIYGKPRETLPFDLSRKHVVTYEMPEDQTDRATGRKELAKKFEYKLKEIFAHIETEEMTSPSTGEESTPDKTILVLEHQRANRIFELQKYLSVMYEGIRRLAPDLKSEDRKNLLLEAIEQSREIIDGFARIVETSVMMDDTKAIMKIYDSFSEIARSYYHPKGFSGHYRRSDFDYFKFIGHELCVTLFSFLLREEKWEIIYELLNRDLHVDNADFYGSNVTTYEYLSANVYLFKFAEHSEKLNERHNEHEFQEADYLLYLTSEISDTYPEWTPWSFPGMRRIPKFISSATRTSYASQLQNLLNVKGLEELRKWLLERHSLILKFYDKAGYRLLDRLQYDFSSFDYDSIGTR